jgi:hypothetical protein
MRYIEAHGSPRRVNAGLCIWRHHTSGGTWTSPAPEAQGREAGMAGVRTSSGPAPRSPANHAAGDGPRPKPSRTADEADDVAGADDVRRPRRSLELQAVRTPAGAKPRVAPGCFQKSTDTCAWRDRLRGRAWRSCASRGRRRRGRVRHGCW